MKRAKAMFRKQVVTVGPDDTLADAAKLMKKRHVGTVVVVEQRRPVGILTDRDLALGLGARGVSRSAPVQALMTCPVTTMRQDEGILRATQHMMESALRRVPVVDGKGQLVGLASLDDLLVLLSREFENLAKSIEPEVAAAGYAGSSS